MLALQVFVAMLFARSLASLVPLAAMLLLVAVWICRHRIYLALFISITVGLSLLLEQR